jgi:hypothetical protein
MFFNTTKREKPMQPLNIFNPADWMDRLVEEFASCPSVIALTIYCDERKPTKVHCTTRAFVRMDLFVPRQKLHGLLHCHQLNNARYAAIKVTKTQNSNEEYWLVVDSVTRYGYLLPIDAFVEAESEVLLPKSSELRAVA